MSDFFHLPGFLGTAANLAADLTLLAMLLIGISYTVGFILARRGRYDAHRWIQTITAVFNLLIVLWMMILPYRDFILPGVPGRLSEGFYLSTTIHAIIGATAIIFGTFVVLRGNGLVPNFMQFTNYKPMMRIAYALYMTTIFLGVWVYLAWFVTNPNPPVYN